MNGLHSIVDTYLIVDGAFRCLQLCVKWDPENGLLPDLVNYQSPVKDPIAMHVVHCLDQLEHVAFYSTFSNIMPPASYELIDIHVH